MIVIKTTTAASNTRICFFCHRDLSSAMQVLYLAEGPICSMCRYRIVADAGGKSIRGCPDPLPLENNFKGFWP
jgi:hypothetical protein